MLLTETLQVIRIPIPCIVFQVNEKGRWCCTYARLSVRMSLSIKCLLYSPLLWFLFPAPFLRLRAFPLLLSLAVAVPPSCCCSTWHPEERRARRPKRHVARRCDKKPKIRLFCDLKKRDRKYNDSEQFSWRNLISFSLNVIFHSVSYLAGLFLPLSPNSVDKQLIPVSHRDENISAKLKVIFSDSMCIWLFIAELLAALLSVCLHVSAGLSRHLGNKVAKQNMMVLNTNRHDLASLKIHVKPNCYRHFYGITYYFPDNTYF